MLKSAWISSPTDWEQKTTSLATREFNVKHIKLSDNMSKTTFDVSYRLSLCTSLFLRTFVSVCRPTSLDAFVFGFVAPLYKAGLPSSPLQSHLRQLDNVTRFCDNILAVYFSSDHPCKITAHTGNIHTLCNLHTKMWGNWPRTQNN